MSLNTKDVNELVYQYLKEAGLTHSAFTFLSESGLNNSGRPNQLAPHSLAHLLERGISYSKIEQHVGADGSFTECKTPFRFGEPHVCTEPIKTRLAYYMNQQGSVQSENVGEELCVKKQLVSFHTATVSVLESFYCAPQKLVTGSLDCEVRVFDFSRGEPEQVVCRKNGFRKAEDKVTSLATNAANNRVAVGRVSGAIDIFRADGTSFEHTLTLPECHRGLVSALVWAELPDQSLLLSSGVDGTVVLWSLQTRKAVRRYNFHAGPVYSLDVDKECATFLSASADETIRYFSVGTLSPIRTLFAHKAEVNGAVLFGGGRNVLSWSDDCSIKAWGLDLQQTIQSRVRLFGSNVVGGVGQSEERSAEFLLAELAGHRAEVTTAKLEASETKLFSASNDFSAKYWDLEKCACVCSFGVHSHPVTALQAVEEGKLLATGCYNTLNLIDVRENAVVAKVRLNGAVHSVKKVGENKLACTSGKDLVVLDLAQPELVTQ